MATYSKTTQVPIIWNYLYGLIDAEKNLGSAGRLATLQGVQRSIDFQDGVVPVAGVQPVGTRYLRDYAVRLQVHGVEMIIGAAACSSETTVGSVVTPQNLDEAIYTSLQPVLDDGNGNGLENVLRDQQNVLLGSTANGLVPPYGVVGFTVGDAQWDWKINRGPSQRTWAYVLYTCTVDVIVQI